MSKFLKKIAELHIGGNTPEDKEKEAQNIRVANAKKKVKDGTATGQEKELADADTELNTTLTRKIKKTQQKISSEATHDAPPPGGMVPPGMPPAGPPGMPPVPPPEPVEPPAPEPLTTEGETFLINLARKALFVDIDDIGLSDTEREHITKEAEPANAKKVAKILRKIIVDYGLSESLSFHSKADVLLEDLKKNGRVVVLVPGSFKPPHKGHFEMVRSYSESWPQGQVHVLISAPSAKSERKTKDGKIITPVAAQQIFELYVQPLNNVTVSISEYPSPVTAAYESLKTLEQGTTVVLGASTKDNDWKRWSYAQSWAEKEGLGLNILDPAETAVDVTADAGGAPYSAGSIRDNFDDFEMIQHHIPDHVDPAQIKQVFDSL